MYLHLDLQTGWKKLYIRGSRELTNDITDGLDEWLIPNALLSVSILFIVYSRFSSLVTSTMSTLHLLFALFLVTVLIFRQTVFTVTTVCMALVIVSRIPVITLPFSQIEKSHSPDTFIF